MTSRHPDYMGVWCPTCKEDCLPIHGRCGFCDTRVDGVVVESRSSPTIKENKMPPGCKIEGCENHSAGKGGWCVGLCSEHISAEGKRRQAVRLERKKTTTTEAAARVAPPVVVVAPNGNGHAPVSLTSLAQAVEHAREELDRRKTELRQAIEAA